MPANALLYWTKNLARKLMGNESRHARRLAARRSAARSRPTCELLEDRITPVTNWVVTTATDSAAPTLGMLRYALANAASGDVITFAPALNGSTITLASSLTVSQNVSIIGPGPANMTINGGNVAGTPDFIVNTGITANISGLTITGGLSTSGGGIRNSGTLSISDDLIAQNGTSANTSTHYGAGIYNGPVTAGNSVTNLAVVMNITDCLITGNNSFWHGGGIENNGTMTVIGSSISNNGAYTYGGGIFNDGTLSLANDTIADNGPYNGAPTTYPFYGGGIANGGTLQMVNTIVSDNTVGTTYTTPGPDVSTNLAYTGYPLASSPIVLANNSLIATTTGYSITAGANNVTGVSALESALASNGGPTQTNALPAGSPAIGVGGAVTTVPAAGIAATGASITLTNAAFIGNGVCSIVITINSEQMLVTNVNDTTNALTVVRGYNGTTAAAHASGANVYFAFDQRGYAMTPVTLATPDIGAYQTTGTAPGAPTVTSISPASGPLAGGTSVTITGTNLANATMVQFGGIPATIVSDSGTVIVAITPAGAAGTVDTTVTTVGWDTSAIVAADHFTYQNNVYNESLAAGALAITMANPAANATLQFSLAGGTYTFTDTGGLVFGVPTGAGAGSITGAGTSTITVPSASVTSISVVLGTGTNLFTITGTGGAAAAPLTVNDGTTAGDQVVISGATLDSGAVSLTGNTIAETGTGTLNAGANAIGLTATTSITQTVAGLVTGGAVSITAGSVGAAAQSLVLNATTLTSNTSAGNGNQFLAETGTASLSSASALNAGTGAITLTGAGIFKATVANAITGALSVTGGQLVVDGTITTPVTVTGAGTLGGTGTVAAITDGPGGTINPGDPITGRGILAGSSANLSTGGNLTLQIAGVTTPGTNFDQLNLGAGTLTLGGTSSLTLDLTGLATTGTITTAILGTIVGNFATVNIVNASGLAAIESIAGNVMTITVYVPVATTILVGSGSPQSATVNTAFGSPLVTTVKDQNSVPMSGVSVTFTGPASAASGIFSNSSNTITATTNAVGQLSEAITANTHAGVYTVNASFPGAITPAVFNLTNAAGAASSIVIASGSPQNAIIGTAFSPLVVTVTDSFGNPVSGTPVTFTAPANPANPTGTFSNSTNTITAATNASGQLSEAFTANSHVGGPYTVTAAALGVATPANFSLQNVSGTPTQIVVTTQPSSTATAGVNFAVQPVIAEEDAFGDIITTDSTHTVTVARGPVGTATLQGGPLTVTFVNGIATFSGLFYDKAEAMNLSFTTNAGAFTATSNNIVVSPAATSQLAVIQQPTNTTAGVAVSPAVKIALEDTFGNVEAADNASTLSIAVNSGPAGGAFTSGSTTVAVASAGVVTFPTLVLNTAGAYTLKASDALLSLTSPATSNFTVSPAAPATQVVFGVQPTNATAGTALAVAVTAKLEDQFGNVETGDNASSLSVAIASGPVGGGFVAGSTTTATVSAGVATFNILKLNLAGSYTLKATDSSPALTSTTSSSFTITPGAAAQLAFGAQPTTTTAGSAINPQVTVKIEDAFGNVEATDNSSSLSIAIASGPGAFAGGSTITATVLNGVASFTTLKLNTAAVYTLQATDAAPALTSPASSSFTVNPSSATQLLIGQQPTNTTAGVAINPAVTVTMKDQFGNVETTDNASTLSMALASGPGSLGGTTSATVNAGVATFSNLLLNTVGAYTLQASDASPALTSAASNSFSVSTNVAYQLVVTQQPSPTATAGVAFATQPVVKEEDQFGNVVTTDSTHTVTAARGNLGTGALLGGSLTVTLVNGVATFPAADLTYDVAETMNLRFTSSLAGVAAATSNSIAVSANVATQIKVTQQPASTAVAGVAFTTQPMVALEDVYGNIVVSDSTHTITAATGTQGSAVLQGAALTETLVNGVATYPAGDLSYDLAQGMNIGFTTNAGAYTTTSNNVIVSANTATRFTVSVPTTSNAGSPFSATVTAYDAYNNVATGYAGAVHFTSSDTGANSPTAPTLPANYTFVAGDNGAHTFTSAVTLVTSGTQTLTSTDLANPAITGTGSLTINSLAATHLALSASSPQSDNVPFSVIVSGEDIYNNPSSSFTNTIHFATSDNGVGVVIPANYTFTAADAGTHIFANAVTLVTTGIQTLTVSDVTAPAITSSTANISMGSSTVQLVPVTLPNPQVGVSYSQVLTALGGSGGNGTYAITLLSGTLPTGLTLSTTSTTTGTIAGIPTAGGVFTFTIQATNSVPQSGSRLYSVTVAAPTITMTPTSLANAQAGAAYSQTFVASGGTAGYTYSVTTGALPGGVALNANTGVLSGTPTATGAFNFTIKAIDHSTGTGPFSFSQAYAWTITAPTLVVNPVSATLPNAQVGVPYTQTLTGSGGTAAYSFVVTGGILPGGLILSSAGIISGTPTSGGPFAITVKMTDSTTGGGPYSTTVNYGLTINPPTLSFAAQPNAQVGAFYSQSITGIGGTAPYRLFSFANGSGSAPFNTMPVGLSLSSAGVISGTATAGGTYSLAITATDSSSGTGPYQFTQNITLVVAAPSIIFTPNPMPAATDAVPYSQALAAGAGTAPYSNFVIHSGALPVGLTLSSSGVVSGTPTEGGTFNFVVYVTDSSTGAGPYTTGSNVSLTVNPPTFVFTPSNPVLAPAQVGVSGYTATFNLSGGVTPYTNFAILNGTGSAPFNSVPGGMAISPSTGILSGTPTASGTFNFVVEASDSSSSANGGHGPYFGSQNYSITVTAPVFTLTPASLPNDQVGQAYSQTIGGTGGTAPYTNFSITSGALPPGLTISSSGTISGIATGGGTYNFTLHAQDSTGGNGPYTISQNFSLTSTPPTITFTPTSLALAQVGVSFTQVITGAGGTAPYGNFAVTAGALPAGLTLSVGGVISGIPTAGGNFSFTISAADSSTGVNPYPVPPHYTGSETLSLTVNPPAFVFTPNALPTSAQIGVPYSQTITVAGGTAPYGSFVISTGTGGAPYNTAPPGLTINPSTGVLSGTPTATGTFNFLIKATDSSTGSGPFVQGQTYTLVVGTPTLAFSPTTLTAGQAGVNYNQLFTIAGGSAPYHNFTIISGALPAGVTLSNGGTLSGAPTAVGSFTFTVQGTDSSTGGGPYSISQAFTWTINAPAIVLSPATLPAAQVGVAYSQQVVASAGTAPYHNFVIVGGALPTGLTLSSTGLISGTPSEGGAFSVQVKTTDSTTGPGSPFTGTVVSTLTVAAPNITASPATLPAAQVGVSYSQTLGVSGGTAPYRFFTLTSGILPAGLTLSVGGTLSGTPTQGGSFTFTVQTTDSSTGSGPFAGTLTYTNFQVNAPAFAFTPSPLPAAEVGASYNQPLSVSGGTAPYSNISIASGSLPAGLTLSTAGLLSGTPTASGSFTFTVQATDSSIGTHYTESQSLTLTVAAPTFIFTPAALPAAQVGAVFSQAISVAGGTAPYANFAVIPGTGSAPYNALPAGLTLNPSSGLLSGTPTAGGAYDFSIAATDSSGGSGPFTQSINYTLTVAAPTFVFSPSTLSAGQAGALYSQPITIVGGTAPYTSFTVTAGAGSAPFNALPAGLTLSPTGLLSGAPTATGLFNFNIQAADSSNVTGPYTALQSYSLTISAPNLVISPVAGALPAAQIGAAYSETLIGSGGTAPYGNFQIVGGHLPSGLNLSATGVISGTPTSSGPYSITVQMTDSTTGTGPWSKTIAYGLTVNPPTIGFAAQAPAQIGVAYSQPIVAVGGTAPYRFFSYAPASGSAPFNQLPAGLTASAAGVISGTPTAGGTFNILVTATDSSAGSGPYTFTKALTIVVNAPSIAFTPNPMPAARDGAFYSQTLAGSDATAPYSNFVVQSGALPAGLTLSSAGTISGVPTEGGAFNFVIDATDSSTGAGPYSAGQNVTLTVSAPAFVFNPGAAGLPTAQVGAAGYSAAISITGGAAPYSNFIITSGALPAGMTLSSNGVLTGIPTAGGSFNFTVAATDSSSAVNGGNGPYTESQSYTLPVIPPSIVLSPASLPNDQVGQPYSQTITGSGGTAPYTNFTISAGALPPGLTISPTGTITGVATGGGTYSFSVQAQDSSTVAGPYTYAQAFTFTSTKPTLSFTPATPATAQVGVSYFQTLSVFGGTAPYGNFILVGGALPSGLTLTTGGIISGTPTSGGTFTFTVQAADSSTGVAPYPAPPAYTGTQTFSLLVTTASFVFSPAALTTNAQAGVPYSQAFTVAGGTAPYGNFALAAGTGAAPYNSAPAGLSFNPSTGVLSGTPTSSGTFTFTVLATDSSTGAGPFTQQSQLYTLTVSAPTLVFATTSLANAQAGVNLSLPLTITGGSAPYRLFTLTSGSLPTGVTLSGGGVLTGAPAAVGAFNFTVQGTDSTTGAGPYSISQAYTWTITAPTIVLSPATLPTATDGVAYTEQMIGSGGTAPYNTFVITGGALPPGLNLSSSGLISGTPTASGSYFFAITADDATTGPGAPYSSSLLCTININAPSISILPASLASPQVGVNYNQALSGSGGTAPYRFWSITAGALPTGLSLSSVGILSGTPTAGGTFNFTVQTLDSSFDPFTGTHSYALTVAAPAISFTPAALTNAQVGVGYSQTLSGVGGTAPYSSFIVSAGALPAGVALSTGGVLSGTPTAGGTFNFTVRATDSSTGTGPYTASQNYTLTVATPSIVFSPSSLSSGQVGVGYSQTLSGSGGTAPYSGFTISSGALPAGVALSSSGTISGTPTAGGSFSFTVSARDSSTGSGPYTANQAYALTIAAPTIVFSPSTLGNGQVGAAYAQVLTGSGGTAPYTNFTVSFGALPAGLTLSTSGTISGVPTAGGNFSFIVEANDSSTGSGPYTDSQVYSLTVANPTITFGPATLTGVQVGSSYSQLLTGIGGTAPFNNFTISSGALPTGLTLSSSGTISGTPTAGGNFNFMVQARDSSTGTGPYTASQSYSVTVAAPSITFSPATLTGVQVGASYTQVLSGVGGTAPYTGFTVSSGALPTGLTLSSSGTISGTPTSGGTFNFTVRATDSSTGSGPYTASQAYSVTVAGPTIAFSPATLTGVQVGVSFTQALTGSGGTAPYTNFTISAGALPAGLTLSSSGTISGTPTAGGIFSFTVSAKDSSIGSGPYTGSQAYSVTVAAPSISFSPGTLPAAQVGASFSQALSGVGGTAPYTSFTISSGALPAGLTLSSSGTLSGTPTAGGSFNFTVRASDSSTGTGPYSASQAYSLTVANPTLSLSPASLNNAELGANYNQALTGVGGTAPYTNFTISAGALPAGITLSTSGTLSGTPNASGNFSFTVSAKDSSTGTGPFALTQSFALTVIAPTIVASSGSLQSAAVNTAYAGALVVTVDDQFGHPVVGQAVTFTAPASGASGTFSNSSNVITGTTNASGQLSEAFTADTISGGFGVTATTTGAPAPASFSLSNAVGAANHLAFVSEPGNILAGFAFSPAVTVQVVDQFGNRVTTDSSTVTLGIGANPGSGSLSGTASIAAVNGLATFSNLSVNKAGTGYTLAALDGSLTAGVSTAFNVTAVNANHLAFVQQPTNTAAGASISPAITVEVLDPLGNVAMADTSSVTLAIAANPGAGTLAGTVTEPVVAGVATFSDLSINKTGVGFTFSAADGSLTGATSSSFNITPAVANHLVFSVEPTNTVAGQSISPVLHVLVEDSLNNVVTSDSSNITLSIGTNAGGGALSGQATVAAVNGMASFSGLSINKSGTGYTLAAADGALAGATSTAFNITAAAASSLSVHAATNTTIAGVPVNFTVTALDPFGNTASSYANTVSLTSSDFGTHTVVPSSIALVSGAASFSATLTTAGSQTVSATDGIFSAQSNAVLVTAAALNHFAVTGTPTVALTAGTPITFTVTAEDLFNNTVATAAGPVSFTSTDTNTHTVLPGTSSLTSGIGSFGATLTTAGSQTITAFEGGISGTSAGIAIIPAAINLTQSSVSISPASVAVGATAVVTLQMRDAFGNNETTGGLAVAFSEGAGIGTGSLTAVADNHNGAYTANFTGITAGNNTISASVNGQALSSSAASVVVTPGASVVSVTATPSSSSVFGQSVTLSASVAAMIAGAGTPTGTVSFYDGVIAVGDLLGSHSLATPATITVSSLSVGTHTIIAAYSGDANFAISNGQVANFVVSKASSTAVVTATPASAVFGQSVTFTATIAAQSPGSGLPLNGGTITFYDGSNPIGTGTLSGGVATFSYAGLTTTTHNITASYAGDADFSASTGALNSFTVAAAGTTTAVSALPPSIVYGQPVTLTATVSAASPSPAIVNGGTVTFRDGSATGALLGTSSAVANGVATINTSALSVGSHTIVAFYAGAANFAGSNGSLSSFAVSQAGTSVGLVSSAPISGFGNPVSFTATVSAQSPSGATVQTGSVTFKDGTAVLGAVTLSGTGVAVFTTSALSKTVHSITAVYADNAGHFIGSTSTPVTQTVITADTLTLTASANPSVFGQTVNVTVKVAGSGVGASGTPTGTVTISQAGTTLGSGFLSAGSTVIPLNGLAVGANSLTVSYAGDSTFAPNSKTLTQTVKAAATTTRLSPVTSAVYGLPVTFTATVAISLPGAGSLVGGTVTFLSNGVALGAGTLNSSQQATFTTTTPLAVGAHSITAVYAASADFAASTSPAVTQSVLASGTTTTLDTLSPTTYGQPVTFTANVAAASGANVAGTVTFKDGTKVLGSGAVSGGVATFTTSTLATNVSPGHSITAVFGANVDFSASASAAQLEVVSKIGTTLFVSSSTSGTSVAGQSTTFTALVSALSTGGGNLTGTVTFADNGATLATVALSAGGTANFTTSKLSLTTTHNITATYNGAANFAGSSNAVSQTVSQADTTVSIASSLSGGSNFGQAVTFTAVVAIVSPGAGALTGTVSFFDNGTLLATVNVAANGVAKLTTAALAGGEDHDITATYNGSANLISESSPAITQTVASLGTTTTISAAPASNWAPNEPITFTARVASGTAKPTGTVTFFVDGAQQATVNLTNGVAIFAFTGFTSAGSHTVNAVYNPDQTNYAPSTSASLTENALNPVSIVLNASDTTPTSGELVTVTASLSGFAGTPTGTVSFYDGTRLLATVAVDANGNAAYSSSALSQGFHTITATYSGDTNYPGITSSSLSIGSRFV